jgi:hypothetical protein
MLHARSDYQNRIVDNAEENPIPENEPVFLLRYWIKLNRALIIADKKKGIQISEGRRKALVLAEAHAYKMDEWTPKKTADVEV